MRYGRQFGIAVFSLLVSVGAVSAQRSPTTRPEAGAAAAGVPGSRPLVVVFPFTAVGDTGHQDWVGRGIQSNLQTDVSKSGAVLVMAPQPAVGADPVLAAKQSGANLAVVGSYQMVADQMRVNGNVIDTATNNSVGSFSATGPVGDLFKLEDALGEQLRRLLPLGNAAQPAASQQQTPAVAYTPAPVVTYSQPDTINNYYSTTSTPYYYPDSFYPSYYGYGDPFDYGLYGGFYGGFAGPLIIGGGYGGRFHDYRGFGGYGFHPGPGVQAHGYSGGRTSGGFHGSTGGGFHGGVGSGGGGFHGGGGGGGGRR